MKLASLPSKNRKNRNGDLIVVSRNNARAVRVDEELARNLVDALENWSQVAPQLLEIYHNLNLNKIADSFDLDLKNCLAPITHAPGFYDGSAFLSHVVRARKARGDVMPESAKVTPLMYQGVSDYLLPAYAPIDLMDEKFGGDFEGEFAAITLDVPKGTSAAETHKYIALFTMFNDITYREIVKTELETKFGFLQSKPNSSFAPLVVTPDELEGVWDGKKLSVDIQVQLNGEWFGSPNGREMNFTFGELIAHACRTRPLAAGNIVGTGTISNESKEKGFACLTEKRFQEMIETGKMTTPWLKPGDRVKIDCILNGVSVFGAIDEIAK
ncbi:MAG: 2-keto-4-pentenoate hydratase [Proteobacteria bacterium]|nr:2-keto-4-pentenoate hydratase [Pseudomonadota bacterium]NBY19458.1 2-keto-4-pentenoate hydratase [bacterium]